MATRQTRASTFLPEDVELQELNMIIQLYGFRVLGFRDLGFRGLGFRDTTAIWFCFSNLWAPVASNIILRHLIFGGTKLGP